MNAASAAIGALLAFAVLIELLCASGVLLMRNAFDRLHYLGPAVIFGPLAIAAAVMIASGPISTQGIKAFIIFLVLTTTGPILTYAIARAIRFRQRGELALHPSDRIQNG